MSVQLNHTIVSCRDQQRSAGFLTGILGLPAATRFGHFLVVAAGNGVSLDFAGTSRDIASRHYAFLVGEEEFDAAFGRIRDQDQSCWADPGKTRRGAVSHRDGGRGLYFEDPDGHRRAPGPRHREQCADGADRVRLDHPRPYRAGLYIEPWNSSSIHVAEASGYQREGLLRSHQEIGGTRRDMLLYATTDPDRFACMTGRSRGSGMQLRSLREQPVVVHRAGQPKGGQRITRRFPAIA